MSYRLNNTSSDKIRTTSRVEFSTFGPAVAFTLFTAGQVVSDLEVDEKNKRTAKNVGTALTYSGIGLTAYLVIPYITYVFSKIGS